MFFLDGLFNLFITIMLFYILDLFHYVYVIQCFCSCVRVYLNSSAMLDGLLIEMLYTLPYMDI